ncbi:NAD(P)-dependent oxidoreductase [Sporosarcina sp. 179-K 3D1 HS]|uniref:NAD(P)-dependent oxidoreductase n=1 Tax=Sporosarcina sp. 179-K 3D1 HS TaxID=3232169 RepID=UPI0039A0DC93
MFPIMVDVSSEKVVIVGGGVIAYHKVENLLRFNITPHVVSPEFHPSFDKLVAEGKVVLHEKEAEWTDVEDAFLLMLVTNDEVVNDRFAAQAKAAGKLVVHASNPALGNAQIPAVALRGKLILSVSTSGASPTLAKQIRNDLAEAYDERYEAYLDFLYEIRQFVKEHVEHRADRQKWLKKAVEPIYLDQPEERERFFQELAEEFQTVK